MSGRSLGRVPNPAQVGRSGDNLACVHPGLARLLRQLKELRETAGLTPEEVEEQLVLGDGWVVAFESGEIEPTIGTLAALLDVYDSDMTTFFAELDLGDTEVVLDRHLTATEDGDDLVLHFPMGRHAAAVRIPGATLAEFNDVLRTLRNELATGAAREAIAAGFLKAVATWPHANPSDLWYFLASHAYQDVYNHPAASGSGDFSQSWKRAGGWALERVIVEHYNPQLAKHGVRLEMPDPERKMKLLGQMGITERAAVEKSDVIAIGTRKDGTEEPFGVVHVKASFAERRTDDQPLSQRLIARGFVSPLVTMDCKAAPAAHPRNRGELGPVQGGSATVSSKRLDIERDRAFDACFSYNRNTLPTPSGQAAAARIHICDFSNPDDAFSKHLVRRWRERQGLD